MDRKWSDLLMCIFLLFLSGVELYSIVHLHILWKAKIFRYIVGILIAGAICVAILGLFIAIFSDHGTDWKSTILSNAMLLLSSMILYCVGVDKTE